MLGWGTCNDGTANMPSTVPVGSMPDCQSSEPGYQGIFDLSGNLREWEDNCDAEPADAICAPRGAAFGISAAWPGCTLSVTAHRDEEDAQIGFRCCQF